MFVLLNPAYRGYGKRESSGHNSRVLLKYDVVFSRCDILTGAENGLVQCILGLRVLMPGSLLFVCSSVIHLLGAQQLHPSKTLSKNWLQKI